MFGYNFRVYFYVIQTDHIKINSYKMIFRMIFKILQFKNKTNISSILH